MGTLKEDIKTQSDWIVKAFEYDGLKLDYTIESIVEIDRFFAINMKDGKPKKGGRLSKKGVGGVLFSIGSYVGETIIKNSKGTEWLTDDNDPQGELKVAMKLPDETIIFPIQKVMKRFQSGTEDSIYPYVISVTENFIKPNSEIDFWKIISEAAKIEISKKPWWKFW
ncbi:MAG: hypothetical protein AB7D46_05635 [Flavobacteriaceae bacterium]